MTPEAIALHHLDSLDSKLHIFTREIGQDRNQTAAWTPYNASLGRRLYKGSVNGSEPVYSPTVDAQD
jgi:3'-5' exoribonuclease